MHFEPDNSRWTKELHFEQVLRSFSAVQLKISIQELIHKFK